MRLLLVSPAFVLLAAIGGGSAAPVPASANPQPAPAQLAGSGGDERGEEEGQAR